MGTKFLEMEEVYSYLSEHGKMIGRKAVEGNKLCVDIVKVYTMHCARVGDPGAKGVLMALLDQYAKESN